jgi:hypothetical protein
MVEDLTACVGLELEREKKLFNPAKLPKLVRDMLEKTAPLDLLVHHGLAVEEVTTHSRVRPSPTQRRASAANPPDEVSDEEVEEVGSDPDCETESEPSPPAELPDETCTALEGITDPEDVAFLHQALLSIEDDDVAQLHGDQPTTFWTLEELMEAVTTTFPHLVEGWKPKFEPFEEEGRLHENQELQEKFDTFLQVLHLCRATAHSVLFLDHWPCLEQVHEAQVLVEERFLGKVDLFLLDFRIHGGVALQGNVSQSDKNNDMLQVMQKGIPVLLVM